MIVLSQAPLPLSSEGDDIAASTRAAVAAGFELVSIPPGLMHVHEVAPALAGLPTRSAVTPAVWVGTIPDAAVYRAVDASLRARAIHLVNDPDAHLDVFEFDRVYARLADLTARTVTITAVAELPAALAQIGLPVFLKGALLSRKHSGWAACVANTLAEAEAITLGLLRRPYLSRGRVLVRELLPLRRFTVPASDFPIGREYRVFLLHGEPLAHGYYWPYLGAWAQLCGAEEAAMLALARTAARRLRTPLVSVDIGQLEDLRWVVIEVGDPQFSGLSFIDPRVLWRALARELSRAHPAAAGPT
jgi:hypothetical protein